MDISVNGAPQESIQRQYRGKNPQRHIGRPDATNGQWVVYIEAMGPKRIMKAGSLAAVSRDFLIAKLRQLRESRNFPLKRD